MGLIELLSVTYQVCLVKKVEGEVQEGLLEEVIGGTKRQETRCQRKAGELGSQKVPKFLQEKELFLCWHVFATILPKKTQLC